MKGAYWLLPISSSIKVWMLCPATPTAATTNLIVIEMGMVIAMPTPLMIPRDRNSQCGVP